MMFYHQILVWNYFYELGASMRMLIWLRPNQTNLCPTNLSQQVESGKFEEQKHYLEVK